MKSVVITGSTRGIGYGLANEFLKRGCQVTVNGRFPSNVDESIALLSQKHGTNRLTGQDMVVITPQLPKPAPLHSSPESPPSPNP